MANAARPQNVCPIPLAIVAPIPVAYNIEQFIIASVIIFFLVLGGRPSRGAFKLVDIRGVS